MLSRAYYVHYPSRLLWVGGMVLFCLMFSSGMIVFFAFHRPLFPLPPRVAVVAQQYHSYPSLGLERISSEDLWEISALKGDVVFFFAPPRPDAEIKTPVLYIRLNSSQQIRKVTLPSRIYLSFNEQGILLFQDIPGPFWLDCSLEGERSLNVQAYIVSRGETTQHPLHLSVQEEPPIQKTEELSSSSALRLLGEAHWWGSDLVFQLISSEPKQCIEIGSSLLVLGGNDWICWNEGHWSIIKDPLKGKGLPIAHIRSLSGASLEWDVWDTTYMRIVLQGQSIPAVHMKMDEWMSSLRVRSSKQVSCVLEKQSIALRVGDWALKENGRWRVLRRADERRRFLEEHRAGDLFVLEQIDFSHKTIRGTLFLANHTQAVPISRAADSKREHAHQKRNSERAPKEKGSS